MNLHGEIMQIKYAWDTEIYGKLTAYQCYVCGHRDARHAAAELALKYDAISGSLRRLLAAVTQASDIAAWPVCGVGDPVGDELRAAIKEAEEIIGK